MKFIVFERKGDCNVVDELEIEGVNDVTRLNLYQLQELMKENGYDEDNYGCYMEG